MGLKKLLSCLFFSLIFRKRLNKSCKQSIVYNDSFLLSQIVKIRQEIKTESLPGYVVVKQYLPTKD
ncbi:hypothetical protein T12_13504 [Trichinella patagoniensis]|uniref:Uncharacterized protein n=1 Tax=Trichinella patagoniensis TaxID=990121 RepID=A0A0V0ZC59_9BILA|nr:hypothetical protein T12_13504 [Trichinella patagoniensis]